MKLSKQDIEEFKQIYLKEFGEKISDSEAIEMGTRLLNVVKIILTPGGSNCVSGGELTSTKK